MIRLFNDKTLLRRKLYLKYVLSKTTNAFKQYDNDKLSIVVALAADYGNLGDVAITKAQTEYLQHVFPNANIIDFPISQTFTMMKSLKKVINNNDIITIVGGGNTSDMYDDIEYCRQFVISQFPNNLIVGFPQTIDFSESLYGQKALKIMQKSYSKHQNLVLTSREENSFNLYKKLLPNNKVLLVPDIVLSLNVDLPNASRKGISFVLRNDSERKMKLDEQNELYTMLEKEFDVQSFDNTINNSRMSIEVREEELRNQLLKFKTSEVVITDRLHGMIFSVITNTPCIAIDNSNKKISGVYKAWLKDVGTLRVLDSFDSAKIYNYIQELTAVSNETKTSVFSYDRFTYN